jgi:hypothetical protein
MNSASTEITAITDIKDDLARAWKLVFQSHFGALFAKSCSLMVSRLFRSLKWSGAVLIPLAVTFLRGQISDWIFMWLLCTAAFAAAKWVIILEFFRHRFFVNKEPKNFPHLRFFLFCLLWPGMDLGKFCFGQKASAPSAREWLTAGFKMLSGAIVLFAVLHLVHPAHPVIIGWLGMWGVILILHFGFFHLLSLTYRSLGIDAPAMMRAPASSTSLRDFWSGRWNTAFSYLAHNCFFLPISRRLGSRAGSWLTFVISGLLHELVISVPARGGYGLPSLYFLIQAAGVLIERSRLGRRFGLSRGLRGWCFVAITTAGPAVLLFHPPFVRNVILPMLHSLGLA